MVFVLHFLIVISCLLERVVTYFSVYTKLEIIVLKYMRLFLEETESFYSS